MLVITMTAEETARYDDGNDSVGIPLMRNLLDRAQRAADEAGETVEIYTIDGALVGHREPSV